MLNKKKKNKLDVIVKELMIHHTEMRDNYDMLYGAVVTRYFEERGGKTYLQSITAWDYLCLMVRRETPNYRSVVRAWAKIQEKFPHLRGNTYEERKKKGIRYPKEELGITPRENLQTSLL